MRGLIAVCHRCDRMSIPADHRAVCLENNSPIVENERLGVCPLAAQSINELEGMTPEQAAHQVKTGEGGCGC